MAHILKTDIKAFKETWREHKAMSIPFEPDRLSGISLDRQAEAYRAAILENDAKEEAYWREKMDILDFELHKQGEP